jgi:hypothetical protein
MQHKIPSKLSASLLIPLFKYGEERTEELYNEKIYNFERNIEKRFIEMMAMMNVRAMVKTDPYSLPFNKEVKITLYGESYINGAYEWKRVFQRVIQEIGVNWDKIRFYFFVEVSTDGNFGFGKVEYSFRYHQPE